jgi:hypothetical protein
LPRSLSLAGSFLVSCGLCFGNIGRCAWRTLSVLSTVAGGFSASWKRRLWLLRPRCRPSRKSNPLTGGRTSPGIPSGPC